jgi:tetratricopeptide (TPR) repeat protein
MSLGRLRSSQLAARVAIDIRDGAMCVWCGAGISVPSGLPTANLLLRVLLDTLGVRPSELERLMTSHLPFELILQTVATVVNVRRLIRPFTLGEPSATHNLLAALMVRRLLPTVCTTNFDLLLEKALARLNWQPGRDYDRFTTPSEFPSINWTSARPRLIKLHGSVDEPEHLATTLRTVALRQVRPEQGQLLRKIFATGPHQSVLLLGYSGSDAFDITPQVRAIGHGYKRLIVVDHSRNARLRIRDHRPAPDGDLFAFVRDLTLACGDTMSLVEELWSRLLNHRAPVGPRPATWERRFRVSLSRVSAANRQRILGRLSEYSGDLVAARAHFDTAVKARVGTKMLKGQLLNDLTRISNARGDYPEALSFGAASLAIADELALANDRAAAIGNLANTHRHLGDFRQALALHAAEYYAARKAGNRVIEGNSLANRGLVYRNLGDYAKAARYHERALALAIKLGNKHSEARQLGNLLVSYRYLQRYELAAQCGEKALRLARELGDPVIEGIAQGDVANLCRVRGDTAGAYRLHIAALRLARRTGNARELWNQHNNLADVLLELGESHRALWYARRATAIARDRHLIVPEAIALTTLGKVALRLGWISLSDVDPGVEQVRRERMPQGVCGDFLRDLRSRYPMRDRASDALLTPCRWGGASGETG